MEPSTVVIDNGTGYTKMGYAGNVDPSYIIPSTIATSLNKVSIISYALFFRKTQNSKAVKWIIILVMKLWLIPDPIKSAIFSKEVKLKTGKVSRSFGTNLFTHI